MSLRWFHVVFIALSVLMTFGFSLWCFQNYQISQNLQMAFYGVPSLMIGTGLLIYSKWFFEKLKESL